MKKTNIVDYFRPKSASDENRNGNAEVKKNKKSSAGIVCDCIIAKKSSDGPTAVDAMEQPVTVDTSPTSSSNSGPRKIRFVSKTLADLEVDSTEEKSFPIPFHKFLEYTNVLDLVDAQIKTARQHSYQHFINNMAYVQKIARRCYLDFYMRPKSRKKYPLRNLTLSEDCPKQVRMHVMEIPEKYQRQHSKKNHKMEDNAAREEVAQVKESCDPPITIEDDEINTTARTSSDSSNINTLNASADFSDLETLTASSQYQPPSFKVFKKFVYFDEEIKERILSCTEKNLLNNENALRAKLELEFYRDFYAEPTMRHRLKWKLRPCPRKIREQILTHLPLKEDIRPDHSTKNTKTSQLCERLVSDFSNHSQSKPDFPYPVSFTLFKKFINKNQIVDEIFKIISKDNANVDFEKLRSNENLRERTIKNYYEAFYRAPEIREKFKVKLKPCPSKTKERLLHIPTIVKDSFMQNIVSVDLKPAHKRYPSPRRTQLSPQAKKQKTLTETQDLPMEQPTVNLSSNDKTLKEVQVKTINARNYRLFMDYFAKKTEEFDEEIQCLMRESFVKKLAHSTPNFAFTKPKVMKSTMNENSQQKNQVMDATSKLKRKRKLSKIKLRRSNSSSSSSSSSLPTSSEDNCNYILSITHDSDETDVNSELERKITTSPQLESSKNLTKNSKENYDVTFDERKNDAQIESLSVREAADLIKCKALDAKKIENKRKQMDANKKLHKTETVARYLSACAHDSDETAVNSELDETTERTFSKHAKQKQQTLMICESHSEKVESKERVSAEQNDSTQKGSINLETSEKMLIVEEKSEIVDNEIVELDKSFTKTSQNNKINQSEIVNKESCLGQVAKDKIEILSNNTDLMSEVIATKNIEENLETSTNVESSRSDEASKQELSRSCDDPLIQSCLVQATKNEAEIPSNDTDLTPEVIANKTKEGNSEPPTNTGSPKTAEASKPEQSHPCDVQPMNAEASQAFQPESLEPRSDPDLFVNDSFFRKVKKNYTLAYAVRRSRGLKRRIFLAILKMSLDEFKKYTRLYERPQFYKNAIGLKKAYEFVIKKDQIWPPILYMNLSDILAYLETKGIVFEDTDLNLQNFSPKLLHFEDLANITDFDKTVCYDYFKETGKTLDSSKLTDRRNSYYNRCWAEDEWIWRVPSLVESWQLIDIGKDTVNISNLIAPPLDVICIQTQNIEMTELVDMEESPLSHNEATNDIKPQDPTTTEHSLESSCCQALSMANHYAQDLNKTEDDTETVIFPYFHKISGASLRKAFINQDGSQSQECKNETEKNEIKAESTPTPTEEAVINSPNKSVLQNSITSTLLSQTPCQKSIETNPISSNSDQTIQVATDKSVLESAETNEIQSNSTKVLLTTTEKKLLPLSPNIFTSSSGSTSSQQLHPSTTQSSASTLPFSNASLNISSAAVTSTQVNDFFVNMPSTQNQIDSLPMDEMCSDPLYEKTMLKKTKKRSANSNVKVSNRANQTKEDEDLLVEQEEQVSEYYQTEFGTLLSPNPDDLNAYNDDDNSLNLQLNKDAQNCTPHSIVTDSKLDVHQYESNSASNNNSDPLGNKSSTSFRHIDDTSIEKSLMDESGVVPLSVKQEVMEQNLQKMSKNVQQISDSNFTTIVLDDSDDEAAASKESFKSDSKSIENKIKKEPKFLSHLQFTLDDSNGSVQVHTLEPTPEIIIDDEGDHNAVAGTNETTSNLIDQLMNPTAPTSIAGIQLTRISSTLSNDTTCSFNEAQRLPSSLEESGTTEPGTQLSIADAKVKNSNESLDLSSESVELLLELIVENVNDLVDLDGESEEDEQECEDDRSKADVNLEAGQQSTESRSDVNLEVDQQSTESRSDVKLKAVQQSKEQEVDVNLEEKHQFKEKEGDVNLGAEQQSKEKDMEPTCSNVVRTTLQQTEVRQLSPRKFGPHKQKAAAGLKLKRPTTDNKNSHLVPQRTHAFRSLPVEVIKAKVNDIPEVNENTACVENEAVPSVTANNVVACDSVATTKSFSASQALAADCTFFENSQLLRDLEKVQNNDAGNKSGAVIGQLTATSSLSSTTLGSSTATTSVTSSTTLVTSSTTSASSSTAIVDSSTILKLQASISTTSVAQQVNDQSKVLLKTVIYRQLFQIHYFSALTEQHMATYELPHMAFEQQYMQAFVRLRDGNRLKIYGSDFISLLFPTFSHANLCDIFYVLKDLKEFHFNSFDRRANNANQDLRERVLFHLFRSSPVFCFCNLKFDHNLHEYATCVPVNSMNNQSFTRRPRIPLITSIKPSILRNIKRVKVQLASK